MRNRSRSTSDFDISIILRRKKKSIYPSNQCMTAFEEAVLVTINRALFRIPKFLCSFLHDLYLLSLPAGVAFCFTQDGMEELHFPFARQVTVPFPERRC